MIPKHKISGDLNDRPECSIAVNNSINITQYNVNFLNTVISIDFMSGYLPKIPDDLFPLVLPAPDSQ